ncbi:hypothetical protein QBC37DRAFT_432125 [Rhypophila decipiens]|uniref:Exonuclease domain-containing protein n=1 Tax=Rhypophila decipiens TaxID=261697 RepID=A0AAN7B385_9PEZI|nr:hypothetical protein QBC37DRAFT_432125 [Rhypophila decipiens]
MVNPSLHRFWDPSLVEGGFEPTPLLREKPRAPVFRKVVVLSTLTVEMAPNRTWYEDQPVHLTLIDFYTGETLITSLINPKAASVTDWRVEETGLSRKIIQRASCCLDGWAEARKKIWDYVNADTIIVGYDIKRDLGALRMAHALVVDLKLVVAGWLGMDAVDKEPPGHDNSTTGAPVNIQLENLTNALLGLGIRGENKDKKSPRDTLEEVLAIRETVMWCIDNRRLVKNWGMAEQYGYYQY